jgi:hypothetical protein
MVEVGANYAASNAWPTLLRPLISLVLFEIESMWLPCGSIQFSTARRAKKSSCLFWILASHMEWENNNNKEKEAWQASMNDRRKLADHLGKSTSAYQANRRSSNPLTPKRQRKSLGE